MKYAFLATTMMFGLAACGGGGGKAALVKACMDDGDETKENCVCMADAAEDALDKPLFNKLVAAAKSGEDGVEAMVGELSPAEQGKFMSFAMTAGLTCGMGQ
ncbi:MAG: hypothetical protein V3V03_09945 [Hyphomonadaceae bacterium]